MRGMLSAIAERDLLLVFGIWAPGSVLIVQADRLIRTGQQSALGGATADEDLKIGNGCPVTEVPVVYEFLQDVQRVVAASFEAVSSQSVLYRF